MERAMSRQAFGKNIADYQYVQRRLTDMKMASVVCRSLTYQALAMIEENSDDASITCSVTKYYAGELFFRTADDMVQIYGHIGFMNNTISKYLRDAVGMRIAGGTSDIQRVNIFNQLARQHSRR
jgi:alkylation response protein AidB-like acyl-CoA dehydrogenase